jgi:hypothetical protein
MTATYQQGKRTRGSMKGSPIDIAARTKRLAREMRLDINSERHWNDMNPDEAQLTVFAGIDPNLGDVELIQQLMAQEANRGKS